MNEDLLRGHADIIGRDEIDKAAKEGRKLRIKFGVDPTRPDIHIGHAVPLRILRRLQDLGHTVIFLIGDYTTRIGDPSGKSKTRPMLTEEEIATNVQTYLDQVGLILDVDRAEIRRNSEWYENMTFAELIKLSSHISVAQILEREDFRTRLDSGTELALHELLYPLMQAYDSVMLECDVEMGGTDQLFNMVAGRALQKKMGQKPQAIITADLLVGLDGVKKMSKSLDNYIGLTQAPNDMFGRVMSIPDTLIAPYYKLCTDIPSNDIDELVKTFGEEANPRDAKASLAREIVRIYHGEEAADKASDEWNATFRDKKGPSDDQIRPLSLELPAPILDALLEAGAADSRGEARRLITQNGVKVNDEVVANDTAMLESSDLIQVGKHRFWRVEKG
jgi:tyrosyl-tRNA synthetase